MSKLVKALTYPGGRYITQETDDIYASTRGQELHCMVRKATLIGARWPILVEYDGNQYEWWTNDTLEKDTPYFGHGVYILVENNYVASYSRIQNFQGPRLVYLVHQPRGWHRILLTLQSYG